jgi:thiamine phosphate synthase YjbQ (UPF0047 family)
MWSQMEIQLLPRKRDFHLITHEIVDKLSELDLIETGILHVKLFLLLFFTSETLNSSLFT